MLDASWLVNGPRWIGVRLASAGRVLSVRPNAVALAGLDLGFASEAPDG